MKYRLFSKSYLGPKYQRKGLDCQDYSESYDDKAFQEVAIADGHGDKNCFRSSIGAEFAVSTSISETKRYLNQGNMDNDPLFSETGILNYKRAICSEWRRRVKEHWTKCSIENTYIGVNEFRYKTVNNKYKARYESDDSQIVEKYLYTAYGTTLLLGISMQNQIFLLQIQPFYHF